MSEIRLPMKDVRTSARDLMVARGFTVEAADQILDDLEAAVGEEIAQSIHGHRPAYAVNNPELRAFDGGLARAENIARYHRLFLTDASRPEFRS